MRELSRFSVLFVVIGIIFIGCGGPTTNPVGALQSDQTEVTILAKGPVVQSVTGSGILIPTGVFRTFSFTAQRFADGSVKGEWQRVNQPGLIKSHGKVTCFTIIGSTVWLGGFEATGPFSTPPNNEVAWRVADNGQGSNAPPDQMSGQFILSAPGFAANYCANTQNTPALFNIEAGNIQVRP